MNVKELIEKLQEFDGDTEVKILIEADNGERLYFEIEDAFLDGDHSEECTYEHVVLEAGDISW